MRASAALLAVLVAVAVVLAMGPSAMAQGDGFVAEVAAEIALIETDVRTGVLPAIAGILAALVLLVVGFKVVGFFTSGR